MKFFALFFIIVMFYNTPAFAFAKKPAEPGASASPAAKKYYMCPMRCVVLEKPGKCPKCGMDMWEATPA